MDAVGEARHPAGGDVHLEGEAGARRTRGTREHRKLPVPQNANDSGGEVEDPAERGQVEDGRGDDRRSGEHARRRHRHRGQVSR